MRYHRLFAVLPAVALANRSTYEFQPGEGYLDSNNEQEFSYIDGQIADSFDQHNRDKRQTMYQEMPNDLGTSVFTVKQGEKVDPEHIYNTAEDLAEYYSKDKFSAPNAVADPDAVSDISASASSSSSSTAVTMSKEESAQVLLNLEHEIQDTINELSDENPSDYDLHQIKLLTNALMWLANTHGTDLKSILKQLEEKNENIDAQVVTSVIARQKKRFKSGRNKGNCRKGTQLNAQGQCEAVLPLNLNYGCWCHADATDIFKGKGQHVDEFDKACKMYKQCLRCVKHDARNDGEICDPGTVAYSTEGHRSTEGIHLECSRANDNNCAINTCCCEVEYVRTVLRLFVFEGVQLQGKFYHKKYDHEEKCEGKVGNGFTNECCGIYPHRRMYNTQGKQCCNNISVFDPYTHVCCDDGNTAPTVKECDSPVRKRKRRSVRNLFDGKKKAKK